MDQKPMRWTTEEHEFLMEHAYKIPWEKIALALGRSEAACRAKFKKIEELRKHVGTWKGI